jgi:hypothetical protein
VYVAVSHRSEDEDVAGRLGDALTRRLRSDEVSLTATGDRVDVLIVLVGASWLNAKDARRRRLLDNPHDPVRRALQDALASKTHVIPVTLAGVAMPHADELPEALCPLAELEPIRASADYWEATVDRLVERVRARRSGASRIAALMRRRPKLSIAATVATVGGIVSILGALGFLSPAKPERGTVEVKQRAQVGVTLPEYLQANDGADPPTYPVEKGAEGYVYDVVVRLDDAAEDSYSLRWTVRDEGQGKTVEPFANRVGDRFGPAEASGVHKVWVPCPPQDGLRYIVQFMLVNDMRPSPQLNSDESPPGDCRKVEE